MELLNAISSRRAIRSYKGISVEDCKLEQILKAGCIMQNMMLEATEQGLGSVVIWESSMVVNAVPDLKKALQIPDEYTAISGIVVGYANQIVEPKELNLSIHVDRI